MSAVSLVFLFLFTSCAHRINPGARLMPIDERAHFVGDQLDRLRDN